MTRSHVPLLILTLFAFGRCNYEAGARKGADEGWRACMAEHGEVA